MTSITNPVAVTQSTSPWVTNISQFGGNNIVTGTGASGVGIPRVTVSNDSNILATQSGAWTTGRTWTLASGTDSVAAVQSGTWNIGTLTSITNPVAVTQSGTWSTGRTWTLASGTDSVTAVQGTSPWVSNISQFGGNNVVTGTGASGAGIPRVTVANDSNILATQSGTWNIGTVATITNPVAVTQSGTWTVQQGTPPWTIQGSSASGASKSGNPAQVGGVFNTTQPTVTTGQTVEAQSTARGALIVATGVDNFNINNISGTISLPTGAATSALQTTGNTSLSTIAAAVTLAQGSTTLGQTGALTLAAVTTAAPTYTTGQTNPLSLTTAGALRVDGSGSTQPVSGTVTANQGTSPWVTSRNWTLSSGTDSVAAVQSGTWNIGTVATITNPVAVTQSGTWTVQPGNTQNTTPWLTQDAADGPVTPGTVATKSILTGGQYNTTLPTVGNNQQVALQVDANGRLLTNGATATQTYTGNVSALNGTVTANGLTFQTYTILVTGTWSGTLVTEKSADGVTWVTVPCYDMAQGFVYATITSNNTVIVQGGTSFFRVRMSSYTSGTAVVTIVGSQATSVVEVIQPSGASLQTVSKIQDSSGNSITNGQKTSANSVPVVLASDQTFSTQSDRTGNTAITVLGAVATATTNGCSSVFFNVTGTWAATIVIEGNDGQGNWTAIKGIDVATGNAISSITTNTAFNIPCGGYSQVRLRASAFTSGSANVFFNAGQGTNFVNQGVAASITNAWPVKPTDGTNSQGYTASSEAKVSVTQPIPAGANVIGAVTQSGTWTVQQGTPPWSMNGNVASGAADSGNPDKVGGVFNTTQPTVTNGQRVDLQSTARGAAIVATGVDAFNITNITGTVALPTGAATAANQTTEITSLQLLDDVPTAQNGAFVKGSPIMGQLDDTSTTAATEDNVAVARITAQRAIHVNLRNNAGTEIATTTTPAVVAGNVASGATDSGNPVKTGGVYNTTAPTLTNGQRGDTQLDAKARTQVVDVANLGSGTQAALSVTNTAVEVKVGGSRLAGRTTVTLYNNGTQTIFWGYTSGVTTATGTPIAQNQVGSWKVGDNQSVFVIATSGTQNTRITEA